MLKPVLERFLSKINVVDSGCWEWQGCESRGYGQFWYNKKLKATHQISYELFKGNIPKGLELDHLCRNKRCCNPDHLEAVTHKENTQRGLVGFVSGLKQRAKTHCPQGHEYNEENTHIRPNGDRQCRVCEKIRGRIRRSYLKIR